MDSSYPSRDKSNWTKYYKHYRKNHLNEIRRNNRKSYHRTALKLHHAGNSTLTKARSSAIKRWKQKNRAKQNLYQHRSTCKHFIRFDADKDSLTALTNQYEAVRKCLA